jgi:hypothetical protein
VPYVAMYGKSDEIWKHILSVVCLICLVGINFFLNKGTNQLIFFNAYIFTIMIIWTFSFF